MVLLACYQYMAGRSYRSGGCARTFGDDFGGPAGDVLGSLVPHTIYASTYFVSGCWMCVKTNY
jgi:hypothetical protein